MSGKPDKDSEDYILVLRVHLLRIDPETLSDNFDDQDWYEELGMTRFDAIQKVADQTGINRNIILKKCDTYGTDTKSWIHRQTGARFIQG